MGISWTQHRPTDGVTSKKILSFRALLEWIFIEMFLEFVILWFLFLIHFVGINTSTTSKINSVLLRFALVAPKKNVLLYKCNLQELITIARQLFGAWLPLRKWDSNFYVEICCSFFFWPKWCKKWHESQSKHES